MLVSLPLFLTCLFLLCSVCRVHFTVVHEGVGTIYTMAPQVLEGVYTSQADLWSIGVIAFMLLSSQMPFYGKKRRHVFEKIMQCRYRFAGARWDTCSEESKDFVRKLLVKDPNERLTAEQALRHPWFKLDYELVQSKSTVTCALEKSAHGSLERYANYSKLKRLALMVVAHKSTTDEIGHLRELFEQYDTERDGTVNLDEFKKSLRSIGKHDSDIERIFKAIDLDGSGLIHYTEFLAATIEARGIIVEERLAEAFDRLDSDDSGFISKDNLKEFLNQGFLGKSLTESYLFDIIDEVDITQDGMISYDEFLCLFEGHEETEMKATMRDINVASISSELNSLAGLSGNDMADSGRSAESFVSFTADEEHTPTLTV
jgi:calcium-dependent protein kinase